MRLTARALGGFARLRAWGVGALGAMRPAIEVVRSRRGLRLTARALGGFARLRAGSGGALRLRGAAHQKRRESMGKIVGLLIARPGRGGKKGGRKDAGAAETKAGAGGK